MVPGTTPVVAGAATGRVPLSVTVSQQGQTWTLDLTDEWWLERTAPYTHAGQIDGVARGGPYDGRRATGRFRLAVGHIGPVQLVLWRVRMRVDVGDHRIEAERELNILGAARAATVDGLVVPGRILDGTKSIADIRLHVPVLQVFGYLLDLNLRGCGTH